MFQSAEYIDNRRLICPEVVMQNPYITQAVATERIRQLHLEAERDRRSRSARSAGSPQVRPVSWMREAWTWTLAAPRRVHAFVLAGQLRPADCARCY
jgi:hypothetical protein